MEIQAHSSLIANSSKYVGERIYFEELNDEHLSQDYIDWMQDRDVLQYLTGSEGGYNAKELKEYVIQMNGSSADHLFGIFLKEGNIHIGNIKIGNIDPMHKFGDLGLVIGNKNMWGKGYATEAIGLATKYAFSELKLNKLIAGMISQNIASVNAFIKVGYRNVGILKKQCLLNGKYVDSILVEKCRDCD